MGTEKLCLLPGFNPDGMMGLVVKPTADTEVWVCPERGLEVLDVLVEGLPAMYRNPAGHRSRFSFNGAGTGPLAHIEGAFTSGLENCGPPDGPLPLHGTFSHTPARQWTRTQGGGVRGIVDCRKLVTGPSIVVERRVEPVAGRSAFRLIDRMESALGSDYMWLYHPNFPVASGTTFVSSERLVVPRPGENVAKTRRERYRVFEGVGEGVTRYPPSQHPAARIEEENFERCYIMLLEPDKAGDLRAGLVAPDGRTGAYVKYNVRHLQACQQAFQLWKNPRDGVSGLEVGSPFLGWSWAKEQDLLCHIGKGEVHEYEIEIGFLRSKAEVTEFLRDVPKVGDPEIRVMEKGDVAKVYRGKVS